MSQGERGARVGRRLSERVFAVPSDVSGPERRRTRTLLWVSTVLALPSGSTDLADSTFGSPRRVRSPHLDVEPIAEGEAQPIGE